MIKNKKIIVKNKPAKKVEKKGKKELVFVDDERSFWVNNGPILKNIDDLMIALENINDDQYNHHVSSEKNDFAQWVEIVLCEPEKAKLLRKAGNKKKAVQVLKKK
ncbi:MAG: hypothetical protein WCW87_01170 [Candidatus Paceibacterota bacterium]